MPTDPARCEDCGLTYEVGRHGIPITVASYTCDDCGGYVEVVETAPDANVTMVDLGGGMVVPLTELVDDDDA